MTVTRRTPPPPPQPEFQLTVTAEELAIIRMLLGGIEHYGYSQFCASAAKMFNAIQDEGVFSSVKMFTLQGLAAGAFKSNIEPTSHTDRLLQVATRVIAEAN